MEEIDIVQLLKRVKEGKAPKKIQIEGYIYCWHTDVTHHNGYFRHGAVGFIELTTDYNTFELINTKIKILDKPIIEELDENENIDIYELARKVNQIIKHINKE